MPSSLTTAIISHLTLPTTVNLSLNITGNVTHQLGNPDFADLLALVTKQRPPSSIRVVFWYGRYFRVEGDRWSVQAHLVGNLWTDLVQPSVYSDYFVASIPGSIRNCVSLFDFVGQDSLKTILHALETTFPELQEFRFELAEYDEEFSLDALVQPGVDRTRFRCPGLCRLTMVQPLWDPVFLEAVAQVAERRRYPNFRKLSPSPMESFTWGVGQAVLTSPTALDLLERIQRVVPQVTVCEHKSPTKKWSRTVQRDFGMRSSDDED